MNWKNRIQELASSERQREKEADERLRQYKKEIEKAQKYREYWIGQISPRVKNVCKKYAEGMKWTLKIDIHKVNPKGAFHLFTAEPNSFEIMSVDIWPITGDACVVVESLLGTAISMPICSFSEEELLNTFEKFRQR